MNEPKKTYGIWVGVTQDVLDYGKDAKSAIEQNLAIQLAHQADLPEVEAHRANFTWSKTWEGDQLWPDFQWRLEAWLDVESEESA